MIENSTGNKSIKYFNTDLSVFTKSKNLVYNIKEDFESIDVLENWDNAGYAYFSDHTKTEEGFKRRLL